MDDSNNEWYRVILSDYMSFKFGDFYGGGRGETGLEGAMVSKKDDLGITFLGRVIRRCTKGVRKRKAQNTRVEAS